MTPTKRKRRLDIYIRVSQVGARDPEGMFGPPEQLEKIRNYAALHSDEIELNDPPFQDLDQSGGTLDRPEFQKVMERALTGQSDGFIVARLSRMSRSLSDAVKVVTELDKAGAVFVSATDNLNLTSPQGRFVFKLFASLHEMERELLLEQREYGNRKRVEEGGLHHGADAPPAGYRRVVTGTNPRSGKPLYGLEIDPVYGPIIKEAFKMRANGASLPTIMRFLAESKVPNERRERMATKGNKRARSAVGWSKPGVTRMLRNRAYLGEARYGRIIKPNAHEALLTPEEFDAAQLPKGMRGYGDRRAQGLLTGLVRCAACGYACSPSTGIYRCNNPLCTEQARISVDKLDDFVAVTMLEYEDLEWLGSDDAIRVHSELKEAYEAARAALIAYMTRNAALPDDLFREGRAQLQAELEDAHRRLLAVPEPKRIAARDAATMFLDGVPHFFVEDVFTLEQQRNHVRLWVESVTITKGGRWEELAPRVKIAWRYDPFIHTGRDLVDVRDADDDDGLAAEKERRVQAAMPPGHTPPPRQAWYAFRLADDPDYMRQLIQQGMDGPALFEAGKAWAERHGWFGRPASDVHQMPVAV